MTLARALTSGNVRVVRNVAGAELWLYDEIGPWGTTASDVATALSQVPTDRVTVRVNSPGGSVFDGIAIYNLLRSHAGGVDVVVDGLAASAASFIAQAGETVTMAPHSRMMIHDAIGFAYGNAREMLDLAALLDDLSANIADIYAESSGGDAAAFRELMLAETWLDPAQAVELGLATSTGDAAAAGDDEEDPAAAEDPEDPMDRWRASNVFRATVNTREQGKAPAAPAAARRPAPAPAPSPARASADVAGIAAILRSASR
jgi:ATP-dependent protease ClpP protease subunit